MLRAATRRRIRGPYSAAVAGSTGEGTLVPDQGLSSTGRWVFYDRSRSKTRVWCGMYAGREAGRAARSPRSGATGRGRKASE